MFDIDEYLYDNKGDTIAEGSADINGSNCRIDSLL